jgi:hypothetical protein
MSGTMEVSARSRTETVPAEPAAGEAGVGTNRVVRLVFGALAAVLVLAAAGLPVWQARLSVKQYPNRQLVLTAYGTKLTGDVAEIKILNHYVGLKVFDMADLPETVLWYPAIAAALVCVALATLSPVKSWWARIGRWGLLVIPLGVLADIQFRLYELGHSMDPNAAFTQPPFVPWVAGSVQVASNVRTTAWPGEALWAVVGAWALVVLGPMYWGFVREFLTAGKGTEDTEAG